MTKDEYVELNQIPSQIRKKKAEERARHLRQSAQNFKERLRKGYNVAARGVSKVATYGNKTVTVAKQANKKKQGFFQGLQKQFPDSVFAGKSLDLGFQNPIPIKRKKNDNPFKL